MGVIDLTKEYIVQSPFTYLQGAGSDGSDDTVEGFHLRWDFRRNLQENHLAKGNMTASGAPYHVVGGFNREDDFIRIHRNLFKDNYYLDVQFEEQPNTIIAAGNKREWRYSVFPTGYDSSTPSTVVLSFPDKALYDSTAANFDPASEHFKFLQHYAGEMNIEVLNKLCFRYQIKLFDNDFGSGDMYFRYESVSLRDSYKGDSAFLSCRKINSDGQSGGPIIENCEDIKKLRLDGNGINIYSIKLFTYDDYIIGTNIKREWKKIGDFSLTEDNTIAFERLEDENIYTINNKWPKFNGVDASTGEFTVKVENYKDRWSQANGLLAGVQKYLTLSQTLSNPQAIENTAEDQLTNHVEQATMDLNYHHMLGLASLDYHIARMLGLGHIDFNDKAGEEDKYIYLMEYQTEGQLDDGVVPKRSVKHLYMTPIVGILDFKKPEKPQIEEPISYGLEVENGTPNPTNLTDENGYAQFADVRFVNINREKMEYERPFETFFETSELFCLCDTSLPIGFGLEYARENQPFVKPELNHEALFFDDAGYNETAIIPNSELNPVYRHQETDEGIHCYKMYSINWFSRSSKVGNQACTDVTEFKKRNHLVPPSNFAAQLIQPEEPLILTTSAEQLAYEALAGDKAYTRISFDWNHVHNRSYQFADKAQVFFNKEEKLIVQGKILSVEQLPDHKSKITTEGYDILSTSPITNVIPNIPNGDDGKFIGSHFSSDGRHYQIEQVIVTNASSGDNPTFVINEIRETNSFENPTGSNSWVTTETYVRPNVGDKLLVSENLDNGANWDNRLQRTIHLESFSKNDFLEIVGSTFNDRVYRISKMDVQGSNTTLTVDKPIDQSMVDGDIQIFDVFNTQAFASTNDGFLVAGDQTSFFTNGQTIKLTSSILNDGLYTVTNSNYITGDDETEVLLQESIDLTNAVGRLCVTKIFSITAYDSANKTVTVGSDLSADIQLIHSETRLNEDGSSTDVIVGGFSGVCDIDNLVPSDLTGVYTAVFNGNPIPKHIDPQVAWLNGHFRISENSNLLPTPSGRTVAQMKSLEVWSVATDGNGNLTMLVNDPSYAVMPPTSPTLGAFIGEYTPIETGTNISINYHPSYLLYLETDVNVIDSVTNEFKEDAIYPAFDEGSRKTYVGVRSIDSTLNDPTTNEYVSHVGTPSALVANEIREPEAPDLPDGRLYATRPDFFGKSTYTLDMTFPNIPYSVLVYKASERKILDTLYTPATIKTIYEDLSAITGVPSFFYNRWNDLVNVKVDDGSDDINFLNHFKLYTDSSFRFPIPNNTVYKIPQSDITLPPIYPFDGATLPGDTVTTFVVDGESFTMHEVVQKAIADSFASQTEAPILFKHIQLGDQTSGAKAVLRDENDKLIPPGSVTPLFNPFPFAVRPTANTLRFTDYNMDGGSDGIYFYYAMELSDKMKKSDPSEKFGPIELLNARPAKEPKIKKVITQIKNDAEELPTAVKFEIESYIESENIVAIQIFRCIDEADAITVRTMDALDPIYFDSIDPTLQDTFEGLDFPLYGEELFYRLVALRKITLQDGVTEELIPSECSTLIRTNIVDPDNPPAPCLKADNGTSTGTELQNVLLRWPSVAYNGTYALQKMNSSGNWVEIYKIKSNESEITYPPLVSGSPDFVIHTETAVLPRVDADDQSIYHRFRVQVENSSGLFNLSDCPKTLATGCFDLVDISDFISITDGNGFVINNFESQEIDDGVNSSPNGDLEFNYNIPIPLPAGHNSLTQIEISISDDQGNTKTKSATSNAGLIHFMDGEGDTASDSILLDQANHVYAVKVKLTTDFCQTGYILSKTFSYVKSPCHDLLALGDLINITDSSHQFVPSENENINDNQETVPASFTIADISDISGLSPNQTIDQLELTLSDNLGNSHTQIITQGGQHQFNAGDGGLVLNDDTQTRSFVLEVKLITLECVEGLTRIYNLNYVYSPYEELNELTDIVSFSDSNSASIPILESQSINEGFNNPGGSITFGDLISAAVPSNHTIQSIDIDLYDGLGGFHSKSLPLSGNVTFATGEGAAGAELDLSNVNSNPNLTSIVRVITDLTPNGVEFQYYLNYVYSPYEDLASVTSVVSFADNNGLAINPLDFVSFDDNTNDNPGGIISITEIISNNLINGDTFGSVEITLIDGVGGADTQIINAIGGTAQFTNGTGGLDISTANKTYTFEIKVITALCPNGVVFVYVGQYTHGL